VDASASVKSVVEAKHTMSDKFLGYARVSRVGERDERLRSPEYQGERIMDAARRERVDVELLPPELDVSGGKESRAILDGAIARIEAGEVAGLVVAQFDRLSRLSMGRALDLLERIESVGGRVISAAEPLDPATPEGEFQRNVLLSVARMERARKAAGFEQAKRNAIAAGRWTARRVPLGYVKGDDGRLQPDPVTAPLLREAFERRAAGESWWKLGRWLGGRLAEIDADAYRIENGVIDPRRLLYMLRNRCYLGESRQGEHVNPDAHPPVVDRATWEAAQRKGPRQARGGRDAAVLTGIARCAGCGRAMTVNSNGRGQRSYVCSRRDMCDEPAQVQERMLDPLIIEPYLTAMSSTRALGQSSTDDLDAALRDLADAEGILAEWRTPEVQSAIRPLSAWLAGERERAERVEQVAERVAASRSRAGAPTMTWALTREEFDGLPREIQHGMLAATDAAVYVRRGRGHVGERVRIGSAPSRRQVGRPAWAELLTPDEWADMLASGSESTSVHE
jgi:site-specific DNA recombinase